MLSIKNLEAGYGKVQVLHGISMEVPKGKVVTLIGSNGAGKTTTMRAISGMISPSAGEISLNGTRTDGMESFTIAKLGLAHSPEGRRVFATMSVTDNLILGAFPRLTGSRPKGDVQGDLERAMDLFPRLKERRTQLAGTLSGGEQQMLAMARALATNPKVLLLDELSMGLAPLIVEELYEIVRGIADDNVSILIVEQFAHEILTVADTAAIMLHGRIEFTGSPEEVGTALEQAYLGGSVNGGTNSP